MDLIYKNKPRDAAYEALEYYLDVNCFPADTKLPGEREMCAMWGINRSTLRSAIGRFIDEGRLYQKKGSGTYTAAKKLQENLHDLKSFTELAKQAGRRPESCLLSMEKTEAKDREAQKLGIEKGAPVWELMRLRLLDGEPAMLETVYVDAVRFEQLWADGEKLSLYETFETVYHETPAFGSEKISLAYTTEREAALLKCEAGAPVFYISGITLNREGKPLEYFRNIARADKFQFMGVLR